MQTISLSEYAHVVFFTGAGMSAESGVPTYRGRGGIWGRGDTVLAQQRVREPRHAPAPAPTLRGTVSPAQYRWEEYACQDAFDADPKKVLDFHEQRRGRVLGCQPHAGHHHLAALQAAHPGLSIITQNTDGMHQRAGARDVSELHGSLWRLRCGCGVREDLAAPAYANRECAECGATLRPDITWFGDGVNAEVFARAGRLIAQAELFVAIGTSGIVHPAVGLIPLAARSGARMIEINLEETEMSGLFGETLRAAAGNVVPSRFKP